MPDPRVPQLMSQVYNLLAPRHIVVESLTLDGNHYTGTAYLSPDGKTDGSIPRMTLLVGFLPPLEKPQKWKDPLTVVQQPAIIEICKALKPLRGVAFYTLWLYKDGGMGKFLCIELVNKSPDDSPVQLAARLLVELDPELSPESE